jgi:hypothetical protein
MVIFEATYRRDDGSKRKIKFARLNDLPKTKVDKRKTVEYPVGKELVWDVQKKGYRVFNWNTVIGKVVANNL